MRLFITDLGREAWFAALVRNVRMEITRFEIGELDIYTLSGDKQAGRAISQFRADNYRPDWQLDLLTLIANDVIGYEGSKAEIGYWRVRNNDGGLVLRIPATAPNMTVGNVRIYAKNTGPYPYPSESSPAFKQYKDVYIDERGGEVLLFVGVAPVANPHWQQVADIPNYLEVRTSIYADGLFNVIDRNDLSFEADTKVVELPDEVALSSHLTDGYSCAVINQHNVTKRPAVAYRINGTNRWVAYPLHENLFAPLEYPRSISDDVLDNGLLDFGVVDPPPINDESEGAVIVSQPRRLDPLVLAFTKKDVDVWTVTSNVVNVNIEPTTTAAYYCRIRTLDLAFLGLSQQLYIVHNGVKYRLNVNNQNLNSPLLALRHGDTLQLEATLVGPISSLTGQIYAELNENPLSADPNNTKLWLAGSVNCHITSTLSSTPTMLDYGLTGRRIADYTWDEFTPAQYVSGLGYDLYGLPNTTQATIQVTPSVAGVGGTGYTYGAQQNQIGTPSYLASDFVTDDGKDVIRRGVSGLAGTKLTVYHNDVAIGVIGTQENPEGSVNLTITDNDKISFRVELVGQPRDSSINQLEVLPAIALDVQGVTVTGQPWLHARFDVAATHGPDLVANIPDLLPDLPPIPPLPNNIGSNSFIGSDPMYIVNGYAKVAPSISSPAVFYGNWVTVMGSPNPTQPVLNAPITLSNLQVSGTIVDGFLVQLEKFVPWAISPPVLLADRYGVATGVVVDSAVYDTFRVKVTIFDPDLDISLDMAFFTELGLRSRIIKAKVETP